MTEHDDWGLTSADDTFHLSNPAEPLWTETVWFSWNVPDRKIFGNWYPVFRPNQQVQFGGVSVYDHTGELPWECPIYDHQWHTPMAPGLDLRDLRLSNSMTLKQIVPNRVFDFTWSSDELELELRFEALMRPLLSGGGSDLFNAGGHLDQPGRVHGRMKLRGEEIEVDCLSQRDRAWGPRRDNRQPQVAYVYGTASADSAFLAISALKKRDDTVDRVFSGYYMHEGVWAHMVSGTREVTRDDEGRMTRVWIDATDELGRRLQTEGEPVSRLISSEYPSMLLINSLTRFDLHGQDAWGEDQDTWGARRWRDFRAAARGNRAYGR
jgi:hypothetical protein